MNKTFYYAYKVRGNYGKIVSLISTDDAITRIMIIEDCQANEIEGKRFESGQWDIDAKTLFKQGTKGFI